MDDEMDIQLTELRQFVYQVEQKLAAGVHGHGYATKDDLYILYTRARQLREKYNMFHPDTQD